MYSINKLYQRINYVHKIVTYATFTSAKAANRSLSKKLLFGVPFGGLIAYDGVVNDFGYLGATERFTRSFKIALLITADYSWHLRSLSENDENYEKILKEVNLRSANRILNGCLKNGGLYIKIGQGIAAINHILPEEYTKTLSKLQNECLPSNEDDVRKLFLQDFGKVPEELFKEFNYTPVAAASLAQVFRAKLQSGEDVAVKVQYIDLQKRFSSDFNTILLLQSLVELVFKDYNFGWILRDIRRNLEQELDFVNEGRNSERCSKDLSKFKFVHVPKVCWDLTKTRVLTAEWINGFKITDVTKIKEQNIDLREVNVKLFQVFSEQIFNTGFVHADPHPGNVFLRQGPSKNVEIVLFDHGLYEYLPENIRMPLCQFWEATILRDEKKMQKTALMLNIENHRNFAEVLFQTPFKLKRGTFKTKLTQSDLDYFQYIAKNHFDSVMQTLKDMPRNMLFVVRNLNTIRAIGKEHGDPVDRGKLMARYAQKCLYKNQNRLFGFIKWIIRRLQFEYCLMKSAIHFFLVSLYLDVLHKLGRSPTDSRLLQMNLP